MRNCIVYLAHTSEEDIRDLHKSLQLLYQNYLYEHPVDVVIFHTDDQIPIIFQEYTKYIDIVFKAIAFPSVYNIYPDYISRQILKFFPHPTHGKGGPHDCNHPGFDIGYRNMCRFFAGEFYHWLQEYDYYMRLDTDSFILDRISEDLFEIMQKNDYYYGYIPDAVQFDNPAVTKGLWDRCREKYPDTNKIPENKMYYTNFEIGKIAWFTGKEYQEFYEYIEETGGIFIHRWGDAPIRYLGVNLLMDDRRKWEVRNVPYQHGAIYNY